MSVLLYFMCTWINFSSLPDGLRQFLFGDHNPLLRYVMYDLEGSNDVDPLETPYTGSTLDLIHGQVHRFHGIE